MSLRLIRGFGRAARRSRPVGEGKFQLENALVVLIAVGQIAAHPVRQCSGDVEAETKGIGRPGRLVSTVVSIEDTFPSVSGDSNSVVMDLEHSEVPTHRGVQPDLGSAVLDRV